MKTMTNGEVILDFKEARLLYVIASILEQILCDGSVAGRDQDIVDLRRAVSEAGEARCAPMLASPFFPSTE